MRLSALSRQDEQNANWSRTIDRSRVRAPNDRDEMTTRIIVRAGIGGSAQYQTHRKFFIRLVASVQIWDVDAELEIQPRTILSSTGLQGDLTTIELPAWSGASCHHNITLGRSSGTSECPVGLEKEW